MDGFLKALGFESKPDYTDKIPETLTPEDFYVHKVRKFAEMYDGHRLIIKVYSEGTVTATTVVYKVISWLNNEDSYINIIYLGLSLPPPPPPPPKTNPEVKIIVTTA